MNSNLSKLTTNEIRIFFAALEDEKDYRPELYGVAKKIFNVNLDVLEDLDLKDMYAPTANYVEDYLKTR